MAKNRFFKIQRNPEVIKETRNQRCARMYKQLINGEEITIPSFDPDLNKEFNDYIEDIGKIFDIANQNTSNVEKINY